MDNRQFDIRSSGSAALAHALRIAWDNAWSSGQATHFKVIGLTPPYAYYGVSLADSQTVRVAEAGEDATATLILFWKEDRDRPATKMPGRPMEVDEGIAFVEDWLKTVPRPGTPVHFTGVATRAWRVFNWGDVIRHHRNVIAAIQPLWALSDDYRLY